MCDMIFHPFKMKQIEVAYLNYDTLPLNFYKTFPLMIIIIIMTIYKNPFH